MIGGRREVVGVSSFFGEVRTDTNHASEQFIQLYRGLDCAGPAGNLPARSNFPLRHGDIQQLRCIEHEPPQRDRAEDGPRGL